MTKKHRVQVFSNICPNGRKFNFLKFFYTLKNKRNNLNGGSVLIYFTSD